MTWAQLPLLRLLIPFLSGIIISFYCKEYFTWTWLILSLSGILPLQFYLLFSKTAKLNLWLSGIVPLILFFLMGCFVLFSKLTPSEDLRRLKPGTYLVEVETSPVLKGKWNRFKAEIISNEPRNLSCGHLMFYVPQGADFDQGDQLLVAINVFPEKKIPNPHEFNYADYLLKQNVSHTVFIRSLNDISIVRKADGILHHIHTWRVKLISKIRNASLSENSKSLLLSLVIGAAEDLDPELKNSFSASGTMHVLSVSGMHIALLYTLFIRIFQLTNLNRQFSFLLVILLIWIYSGLTGFSPSVMRAAVICSFMVLGELTSRIGSSMNLLAASAILLLWFDPFLLFNPGFQLSYTAVAGILLFQRKLNDLFPSLNRITKEIVNALTVTIAAQLGTLGVSLYYFGQFPTYFLFANLVIVPLSSVLLYAGIIYVIIILFMKPPEFIDQSIDVLFNAFTYTVNYFGELPGAILQMKPDLFVVVLLYILLLFIYFINMTNRWLIAASSLSVICMYTSLILVQNVMMDRKGYLCVTDQKGFHLGLERNGIYQKFSPDSIPNSLNDIMLRKNNMIAYRNSRIYLVDSLSDNRIPDAEIILIGSASRFRMKDLEQAKFNALVIMRGVGQRKAEMLEELCREMEVRCWNVNRSGAFILPG